MAPILLFGEQYRNYGPVPWDRMFYALKQSMYHFSYAFVLMLCLMVLFALHRYHLLPYCMTIRFRSLTTILIDACSVRFPDYRPMIRTVPAVQMKVQDNHTHPDAANNRTSSNAWIDNAIHAIGFVPYSISGSNRDARAGNALERDYYFSKDLSIEGTVDVLKPAHALKIIDVDYYLDMKERLSLCKPTFIYTFVPEAVAGSVFNGQIYIKDDTVFTDINGGAQYSHKIWDYGTDCLQIDYWWGSIAYLVEPIMVGNQRRIIFMNPIRKIFGPFAWFLSGRRLRYMKFSHGNVNFIRTLQTTNAITESFISIAASGSRVGLKISESVLQAAIIRCKLAKDPSISDVERIFRAHSVEQPDVAAALFIQCFRHDPKVFDADIGLVTVPSYLLQKSFSYQTLGPLVTEDGKPSVRQLIPPILPTGFAPVRSFNNDNACIRERVLKVANPNNPYPPFYRSCVVEFINKLIPIDYAHTGVPWSESQVEAVQNRPSQRAANIRNRPFAWFLDFKVKAFQKAEIYGKVGAPRNIGTVPTDHRLRLSSYMYPLAEMLKKCDWYAFGLNPREVTDRVLSLVSGQASITSNDFSKFDGTHGAFKADVERMVFLRFFAPCYHQEISDLLRVMINAKAITKFGVAYNVLFSLISGAATTSGINTIIDAIIAYICLRRKGLTADQSWEHLGLYGGDDNLNRDIDPELHVKVAASLGYTLKTMTIKAGNPVPFLGRIFLDPWSSRVSVCDMARRMRSLHLTVIMNPDVPSDMILARKAKSYLVTDPNTPVITPWCNMILRNCKDSTGHEATTLVERPYLFDPVNNWDPPSDDVERGYAMYLLSYEIGVSVDELQALEDYLDNFNDHPSLLDCCLDVPMKAEISAVVGNDLITV